MSCSHNANNFGNQGSNKGGQHAGASSPGGTQRRRDGSLMHPLLGGADDSSTSEDSTEKGVRVGGESDDRTVSFNMPLVSPLKLQPLQDGAASSIDDEDEEEMICTRRRVVLEDGGIDLAKLRTAFSALDVQGDGGLELFEFRSMWKAVFPQRQMDPDTWKYTERMFSEIDVDGSAVITFQEIVAYLERTRSEQLQREKRPETLREWVWQYVGTGVSREWLGGDEACTRTSIYVYKSFSMFLALTSVIVVLVESVKPPVDAGLSVPDIACNALLTLEFLAWLYSFPGDPRWKVLVQGHFVVELLALVAFYTRLASDTASEVVKVKGFSVLRMTRVMRLTRLLQVLQPSTRASGGAPEIGKALLKSTVSLVFLFVMVVTAVTISSTLIYFAEQHEASYDPALELWVRNANSTYPDAGEATSFQSIPDSMWWGLVTISTVGYGDSYPSTAPGKLVASFTILAGLIVVSFPITILSSTFQSMEQERADLEKRRLCCKEFYEGIQRWLRGGGRVGARPSFSSPMSPVRSSVTSPRPRSGSGCSTGDLLKECIRANFDAMEGRLSAKLDALTDRVAALESALVKDVVAPSPPLNRARF